MTNAWPQSKGKTFCLLPHFSSQISKASALKISEPIANTDIYNPKFLHKLLLYNYSMPDIRLRLGIAKNF